MAKGPDPWTSPVGRAGSIKEVLASVPGPVVVFGVEIRCWLPAHREPRSSSTPHNGATGRLQLGHPMGDRPPSAGFGNSQITLRFHLALSVGRRLSAHPLGGIEGLGTPRLQLGLRPVIARPVALGHWSDP